MGAIKLSLVQFSTGEYLVTCDGHGVLGFLELDPDLDPASPNVLARMIISPLRGAQRSMHLVAHGKKDKGFESLCPAGSLHVFFRDS